LRAYVSGVRDEVPMSFVPWRDERHVVHWVLRPDDHAHEDITFCWDTADRSAAALDASTAITCVFCIAYAARVYDWMRRQ
jgi:hypothetical protein